MDITTADRTDAEAQAQVRHRLEEIWPTAAARDFERLESFHLDARNSPSSRTVGRAAMPPPAPLASRRPSADLNNPAWICVTSPSTCSARWPSPRSTATSRARSRATRWPSISNAPWSSSWSGTTGRLSMSTCRRLADQDLVPADRRRAPVGQPRADHGRSARWYQSNTRKARSVFHRLGRPSPSSISTAIAVVAFSSGHRPSVALRLDQLDRLGHALVGRDAGSAQVLESPQHVVVPPGREGEARPGGVDDLTGRPPPEETALEEVLLPAEAGLRHLRPAPAGQFVLEQGFQHADRGVERRPRRAVRRLAVPAAVGQLLAEQPVDDPLDSPGRSRRRSPPPAR